MTKKLFALLMVVAMLAMAFVGCGAKEEGQTNAEVMQEAANQNENTVEETIIEGDDDNFDAHAIIDALELEGGLKIAFIVKTLTNPFFVAMEEGVREYVREEDTWTTLQCDNEAAKMLTVAEDAANGGYDIILMTPINSSDIAPIEAAYNNGSMVVLLDTTVVDEGIQYCAGTVCTDNYMAGYMCGEAFIEDMMEKYGEVKGQVVLFENPQGLVTLARIQGFEDAIADYVESGDIEIAYREVGKGQVDTGLVFMETVLQRFTEVGKGEGSLVGVMSMNDPSAQGCANALDQAGYTADDCFIYGVDGSNESLDYIANNMQRGTSLQYPGMMAARGLAIAYQKLAGVELSDEECFLEISTSYIDAENAADYRDFSYIGE
jgi:ribose transport system substrate-binding protein